MQEGIYSEGSACTSAPCPNKNVTNLRKYNSDIFARISMKLCKNAANISE